MNRDNYPFPDVGPSIDEAKEAYKKHSYKFKILLIIALIVLVGFASYYQVGTDEVAVLTRLGKFKDITEPGLHFKIPVIDRIDKVKAKRQLKQEFGFRTEQAGVKSAFRRDLITLRESTKSLRDLARLLQKNKGNKAKK